MKRILTLILSCLMALSLLAGCQSTQSKQSDKLSIVATNFPAYDFARQIAGDQAEITMLLPPGAESHSFEPTPKDITAIQNCDVFLYVGGDSDTWVKGVLDSLEPADRKVISMMDLVETKEEEIKEGMQEEHSHAVDKSKVYERPLSDWNGEWQTLETNLKNGDLEEYIQAKAAENEIDAAQQKTKYESQWKSDYPTINIADNKVTFAGLEAAYQPLGYKIVEGDHGDSVWYGYQAVSTANGAPRFLAINDHGTGSADTQESQEHAHHEQSNEHAHQEEHHQEGHDEEHSHDHGLPHYHLRYGNESFDALTQIKDWSPLYFPASATGAQVAQAMSDHGHSHDHEYDEHVWTSPVNAKKICTAIAQTLEEVDADNRQAYQANLATYSQQLDQLDDEFRAVVQNANRKTLIFGDRFPFRYFVEEYGLDYYAAFPGCSTETEASAKTVAFLIDKVKAEQIPVVFHIELSNEKMADTICEATGAKKALLHSCHNITRDQMNQNITYLELMQQNVGALKEALN